MNRPVTALCDQCGKITDINFKQRYHPNKIQETYFKCEHCYYHYTSFVTDAWVRKKQRHKNTVHGMANATVRLGLQDDINNRMKHLKHNLINFGRADL